MILGSGRNRQPWKGRRDPPRRLCLSLSQYEQGKVGDDTEHDYEDSQHTQVTIEDDGYLGFIDSEHPAVHPAHELPESHAQECARYEYGDIQYGHPFEQFGKLIQGHGSLR